MRRFFLIIIVLGIITSCNPKEKNQKDSKDFAAYGLLIEELQTFYFLLKEQTIHELADGFPEGTNAHLIYDSLTTEYIAFLDTTSEALVNKIDLKTPTDYSGDFSNPKFVNDYFFDELEYSPKAVEFIQKTNEYRNEIAKLAEDENLVTKIEFILQIYNPEMRNGEKVNYLNYYYEDMPLIGVLAYLNHKKNSILELELEYLKNLKIKPAANKG
nr:hypothetical protein [uncultured Allomuricauda sp.]